MLSPSQRRDQLPAASERTRPGDIFQDSPGGRWCYNFPEATLAFVWYP